MSSAQLRRIGLLLALGTILVAIAATQWPFHYGLTQYAVHQRWRRIDWRWFPLTPAGAVRLDRDFALNLVMLMPLGVGFALWRRAQGLRLIGESLLLGLATSVTLELAQLLTPHRYTTVADVWRNAIGCAVGCLLARCLTRAKEREAEDEQPAQ